MKSKLPIRAAAVVCSLLGGQGAWAVGSASAWIGVPTIQVIDLRPEDDLAPAFALLGGSNATVAYTNDVYVIRGAFPMYQPSESSAADAFGEAVATTGTTFAAASTSVWHSDDPVYSRYAAAFADVYATFELTPWAAAIIEVPFQGRASTTIGRQGDRYETASGGGAIQLSINVDGGRDVRFAYRSVEAGGGYDGAPPGADMDSFEGIIRLEVSNLSDATMAGDFYAGANVSARTTLPVPEPSTALLFFAGVTLLARRLGARRADPARRS
jgi:hypothetical protein